MKEFLLDTIRSFKAEIATAMGRLNYNFKSENTNVAKDISWRMTSQFISKFQAEEKLVE